MNQENTSFEKQKKLIARRNALKLFFIRFPDVDPIFLEIIIQPTIWRTHLIYFY